VLDISFNDDAENSLYGRCYGKSVEQVVRNAGAFNEAMRGQGIASCGKHFPGYSAATSDAHYQLPRIDRTREELDENELAVFRAFIGSGGSPNRLGTIEVNRPYLKEGIVDSMMVCHGWYPCFEPQPKPATVSRRIVTELLRNEFGFDGLVMTDDLDMGAILIRYRLDDTIRLCLEAGNDIVMLCHRVPEIETVHRILGTLPSDIIERAQQHIANFKKNLSPPEQFSESTFQEINREIADLHKAAVDEEEVGRIGATERQISPVERF
jgi:beta-N-acetylhexosaminidase